MFKSLCLSGGGITGFVHLGVLHHLNELSLLNEIDTVVCTSIGAVVGSLYAVGMKPTYIRDKLVKINNDIMQYSKIEEFFTTFGMDTGEYFLAQLTDIFLEHKKNPLITLKGVVKKYGKRLIITATNLSKHSVVYFTPETHPDMRVLDAVRMSISIPFLFTAVVYDGDFYVDGGIKDNYPLKYCLHDFKQRYKNLVDEQEKYIIGSHIESMVPKKICNIEDYIYAIFACCMKRNDEDERAGFKCTVFVPISEVSSMDFDADVSKRDMMFTKGESATKDYMTKQENHKSNVQST